MKITSRDVVTDAYNSDTDSDVRNCVKCGGASFHVPQTVMVLTGGGARSMRLWACEKHPLPDMITDQEDS